MNETREELDKRIADALEIACNISQVDGAHHKAYAIDQMVRALTGCPVLTKTGTDSRGNSYTYEDLGESEEYVQFVKDAKDGDDGPESYDWEQGIAP